MAISDPRKWVQVANTVRTRIDSGELKPGAHVSIGYEAQAWETSREVVAKALQLLEREGRLARYPGHGYVVTHGSRTS